MESKPARDEKGRLLPGQTANPNGIGGRPKLPDWFKSRGPDALRVLIAQATGEVVADENGKVLPAVQQVATESTAKERAAAAELVANRLYGKAPDTLDVEVGARDAFLDALVALAHPRKSEGQNEPDSSGDGEDRGGA